MRGGESTIPTKTSKKKKEYTENPGWASAFFRPENEGDQPRYTGTGLDADGNEIQISIWPRRAKSGVKYLRVHIEPPYDAGDDDDEDDDDDIPF